MPELPEVETVKESLKRELPSNPRILNVWISPFRLRFPYPKGFLSKLKGKKLHGIHRRAKYLLFDLGDIYLVNHLGMSGTWREGSHNKKHDHLELHFENKKTFVFNDPRRFGFADIIEKENWEKSKFFSHLGPEPLDKKAFTEEYLFEKSRKKQVSIKNFLMDQKVVVGVGNIYASEVLFLSSVRPQKLAGKITKKEAHLLVKNIHKVLKMAIRAGGSYIKDFQNIEGASSFQRKLQVYGREKEACFVCDKKIKKIVQSGRSSFYCPQCQS